MDEGIIYETSDRSMTVATRGCLFITIHRRDYSADEIALLHHHQLVFARARAVPFPLLTVLDVTEKHIFRFSKGAREATLELVRDVSPHIRCSSVVFDRGGFAGSAIRSLVTTVNLFAKEPYPSQVFGELGAALGWIESKLDRQDKVDFDRAAAAASVRTLRERRAPSEASSSPV
jgi:hypothetical protein